MGTQLRRLRGVLGGVLVSVAAATAGATAPPTITVSNQVAQCIKPYVQVYINPRVQSTVDPLPSVTFSNRVSTDPNGYPRNVDPDNYPYGSRLVSITACDHKSPKDCATSTISLIVQDTLPPTINAGLGQQVECSQSAPSGCPAAVGYCENTAQAYCQQPNQACYNPNQATSPNCTTCLSNQIKACRNATPGQVHLTKPTVSDICDPNPQLVSSALPTFYPLGTSVVQVSGKDFTGNVGNTNVTVRIVDTTPPKFLSTPTSFDVVSHATGGGSDPLHCSGTFGAGTKVTLTAIQAYDACTASPNMVYEWVASNSSGVVVPQTSNPVVCLPDGTNTVQFIAIDGVGNTDTSNPNASIPVNAPTTATVTVSPSFVVNVALAGATASGWINHAATLSAVASGQSSAVTWSLISGQSPSTTSITGANNANYVGTFTAAGTYCPTYLTATAGAATGGAPGVCFGIDTSSPALNFNSMSSPNMVVSHGQLTPMAFNVSDAFAGIPSGIRSITATLSGPSGFNSTIYQNTVCTDPGVSGSALPQCGSSFYVNGCNVVGAPGCNCPTVDGTGNCSGDGRMNFSSLANGNYTLTLSATDAAGNTSTSAYPFVIADLVSGFGKAGSLTGLAAQVTTYMNLVSTPVAALPSLQKTINLLQTAATFFTIDPGQSFLLGQQAYVALSAARSAGANTVIIGGFQSALAGVIQGEVNVILAGYVNWYSSAQPWAILNPSNSQLGVSGLNAANGQYEARNFLVQTNSIFRDYIVNPSTVLALATSYKNQADAYNRAGDLSDTINASISAYDALALIYNDRILATLYGTTEGYPLNSNVSLPIQGGTSPLTYFGITHPNTFGDESSRVVLKQFQLFTAGINGPQMTSVMSPSTIAVIQNANASLSAFANAVQKIQNSRWAGYGNYNVVHDIYLNAIQTLQAIQALPSGVIHSRYWAYGIGLTLANVVNFSMYEGPTALTCILQGSAAPPPYSGQCGSPNFVASDAPAVLNSSGGLINTGNPNSVDFNAQVAECRFSTMMYQLTDGVLTNPNGTGSLDLFNASECLIIQLYNRYYTQAGGGRAYFPTDVVINPNTYGCGTVQYALSDMDAACPRCGGVYGQTPLCAPGGGCDNNCNGIDDDCNGYVDDEYLPTTCGCGSLPASVCPCAATSSCIDGQSFACTPGAPPTQVDAACNGKDNNCDGVLANNFVPTTCGVGGCMSSSSCSVTGGGSGDQYNACVPLTASGEVCDHVDNNCNVLIDEGLDNDQDGYGCNPNIQSGCNECVPNGTTCTGSLLCANDRVGNSNTWTGNWDCNDQDPTIYPGNSEICDGKDNNCNGLIDEGVLNACGTCDSTCIQTTSGGAGSPFTPTPTNSTNVSQDPNTGSLGLTSQALNTQFAWVSNDTSGTLSKIDTTTGHEVGRYCQALQQGIPRSQFQRAGQVDPTGATYDTRAEPTVCAQCTMTDGSAGCNRGSRTTVDLQGDVFIANRAFGYQGNYSKVANSVANCVDVNGDGVISTSHDANGDGVIEMNPNEFFAEADECILWTRRPTTWQNGPQPQCVNNPSFPVMNANTTLLTDYTTCTSDPTGSCYFWYDCEGSANTACTSNGNVLATACTGDSAGANTAGPNWCTLSGAHCAKSSQPNTSSSTCRSKSTATSCNGTFGCAWVGNCAPTACNVSASEYDKGVCNGRTGCAMQEVCYHVGVGYFLARAAAIDAAGWVWAGNFNYQGFFQLNPTTGYVQRWIYTQSSPYGAVIDKNGLLWSPDSCCGAQRLVSVNINANQITYNNPNTGVAQYVWNPLPSTSTFNDICVDSNTNGTSNGSSCYYHYGNPGGSYGIAIDGHDRVWIGGYPVGNYAAFRYDPSTNTWASVPVTYNPNGTQNLSSGYGRGVTVDASGTAWVAQHGYGGSAGWWFNGRITGYNANTLAVVQDVYLGTSGQTPIGVGIGYGGRIWSPAQSTSNIVAIDPNTGASSFFPVGGPPYTYSDFTGSILRTFTSPQGSYSEVDTACYGFPVSQWYSLQWTGIEPVGTANNGTAPSQTNIEMRMRVANQLVTQDANGNPVDPGQASQWSYWFPDDITNPTLNPSDPNRVYYYTINPNTAQWPTSGPCAGMQQYSFAANQNQYTVAACADLTQPWSGQYFPLTYTWNASVGPQPVQYVQIQAVLIADGDDTVHPTFQTFSLARTCPQL